MVDSVKEPGVRWIIVLMVFAVLATGCLLPQVASASTVPVWQVGGKPLEEPLGVKSSGTLKFKDHKGGYFGEEVILKCNIAGLVSVGADRVGEVTGWTASGCTANAGTCGEPKVSIQHLAWHTELTEVEGKIREAISAGRNGSPEYQVECSKVLEETCSGATNASASNVSGGVDLTFNTSSAGLNCTRGGTGEGKIEGTMLIESPVSGTLTAANATAPEGWALNGTLLKYRETVKSSGKLTFEYEALGGVIGYEVSCNVSAEEYAGALLAGEVTKVTLSGCSSTHQCEKAEIKALGLPWGTELGVGNEGTRDGIVSSEGKAGGGGTFILTCNGVNEDVCPWVASTHLKNVTEGVEAEYAREEQRGHCTYGGQSFIKGSELIKASGGQKLSVK